MRTYEGRVEIPLEDYFAFVRQYIPNTKDNIEIGIPIPNKHNSTIEVAFAGSGIDDCSPNEWSVLPEAVLQWKRLE